MFPYRKGDLSFLLIAEVTYPKYSVGGNCRHPDCKFAQKEEPSANGLGGSLILFLQHLRKVSQ